MSLSIRRSRSRLKAFFHSIRFRIMLWFILILAVVLAALCTLIYTRQVSYLHDQALSLLAQRDRQLEALFRFSGMGSMEEGVQELPPGFSSDTVLLQQNELLILYSPQTNYVVRFGVNIPDRDMTSLLNTAVAANSQPASFGARPPLLYQDYTLVVNDNSKAQDYVFLISTVVGRRSPVGFLIFGSPADPGNLLPGLLVTLILSSLGILFIASAGGYWLAGRAMRPVQVITRTARGISETGLDQRINIHSQDELGELAETFDEMLGRLHAAFERQRQFTADASHELRTPLTIIDLEASRALASKRPVEEYQKVLRTIQNENEFMTRLVNELLTLARMDAGQISIRPEPLDMSDIALEAIERFSPLAARQGVQLNAGELPPAPFQGDHQYILQMVSNLVDNAIKYSCPEGGIVTVETGQMNGKSWVSISDNGIGIPSEDIPHIFDRFYRVDKVRAQNEGGDQSLKPGIGLGLALVQWIANAHHGAIDVHSIVGEGTTFQVTFPGQDAAMLGVDQIANPKRLSQN